MRLIFEQFGSSMDGLCKENERSGRSGRVETEVKMIGYYGMKLQDEEDADKSSEMSQAIKKISNRINTTFIPIQVVVNFLTVAFIDQNHKCWLLAEQFRQPISIYALIKKLVFKMYLFKQQLIVQTLDGFYLISWTSKKTFSEDLLTKIRVNEKYCFHHCFEIHRLNFAEIDDLFSVSNIKKFGSENEIYHINQEGKEIIHYPKMSRFAFKRKIVGLSVGKTHLLSWDEGGKLYSWGYRSIALGYENMPTEDYVSNPQLITTVNFFVVSAFAATNYSIALSDKGQLYEWGIKKHPSKEELIFEPKVVESPFFKKSTKIISLKGKNEKYCCLSVVGDLYIWGKDLQDILINAKNKLNLQEDIKSVIAYPIPVLIDNEKVLDFDLEDSYMAVIYSEQIHPLLSEKQRRYWSKMKINIKENILTRNRLIQMKECKNELSSLRLSEVRGQFSKNKVGLALFREVKDPIEQALIKIQSKRQYIENAKEDEKILSYIMQPIDANEIRSSVRKYIGTSIQTFRLDHPSKIHSKLKITNRLKTYANQKNQHFQDDIKAAKQVVANVQRQHLQSKISQNKQLQKHSKSMRNFHIQNLQKQGKTYHEKLQEVLKNKQFNQINSYNETIKMVENRSYEFRVQQKISLENSKQKEIENNVVKNTLQKFLIQNFLVRLMTRPLNEGRQIKIVNFARHLRLSKIQKKIRELFERTRIKILLKQMKSLKLTRFIMLLCTFKRYIAKFRSKKFQKQKKAVVTEIFKRNINQKIKVGISTCLFNVKKLQKFQQWLAMVKCERKKCLKTVWKIQVLSVLKINTQKQTSHVFYIPKNFQEITFESLYQERVLANPLLKLSNFLNKYSIFKIKASYFQKIVSLFSYENRKYKSQKMISSLNKTKRIKIKFFEEEDILEKGDRLNFMQSELLPYSLHYNVVVHARNYEINIPEIMKQNDKWVQVERKILENIFHSIIREHQINYKKKRREYEIALAHYISKKYDSFAEKRWKYIIEFNQTEKTRIKHKREQELRRILGLLGMTKLLDADVIPEKQAILQESYKRSDAPTIPNSNIVFGSQQFKKYFKSYFESLCLKSKEIKRLFY